jgi:hypothetical protein
MKSKKLVGRSLSSERIFDRKAYQLLFFLANPFLLFPLAAVDLEASRKSHASLLYIPNHAHNPEK